MQRFLQKHQKGIASILLSVFFSEWWLSAFAVTGAPQSLTSQKFISIFEINQQENIRPESLRFLDRTGLIPEPGNKKTISVKESKVSTGPGPGQPEMQSFQSIGAADMVDLFTGDFSYTIPLLDVGGYPVNIHYRSGITMDQEASWVGLGWNINPGTISRNMRGLPDDFNGEDLVVKTHSMKPNWTAGANAGFGLELFGLETTNAGMGLNMGLNGSLYYNNYKGLGLSTGLSLGFNASQPAKGSLTAGMSLQTNSQTGITLSPSFDLTFKNAVSEAAGILSSGFSVSSGYSTRAGLQALTIHSKGVKKNTNDIRNNGSVKAGPTISGNIVHISLAHQAYTPLAPIPFTSYQYGFQAKPGSEFFGMHPNVSLGGFYSRQYIADGDKTQTFPAYGYLHFQKAKNIANALLDYNREKELVYHADPPVPHIAIPIYTYDIYTITAEGNGGMFRPYRGDIGYMRDAAIRSKSEDGSFSLDLGSGNLVHAGFDIRVNTANTQNSEWEEANLLLPQLPFVESDSVFEAVYFKNPAEKTINDQRWYDQMGDTDPVMAVMNQFDDPVLSPFLQRYKNKLPVGNKIKVEAQQTLKRNREKRSQVISYLPAEDAALFALDKRIMSYPVNTFFGGRCGEDTCTNFFEINCDQKIIPQSRISSARKKHHISELTVLNPDGRRYIYGLPVYNLIQKDVSFSVEKHNANTSTGQVAYTPGVDNSVNNKLGKDNFYAAEQMPGYAHSFLLTGILSSDYTDKTGDGITDDDMGDAIKFNYTKIYGETNPFRWRTPFAENLAQYNEGLKTDHSDDKGSYIYGEKEVWYLHSLESKSMIAAFTLNDPAQGEKREDIYGVKGENGGPDQQQPLRYLKQIDLYSKADYLKNKTAARPVKTIHFEYNYELCPGNPSSVNGKGKLTLKKIWFTYNGNNKGQKNPYVFLYHPRNIPSKANQPLTEENAPEEAFNPSYHPRGSDRWGSYKNASDNPGGLNNADYPYVLQSGNSDWDSVKAATNAAAWTLSDIILPSGGRLNIEYEADDYAFVQNKRAMQLCILEGMGKNERLSEKKTVLYGDWNESYEDYRYAFVRVPSPIVTNTTADQKKEIRRKYLDGVEKLYFKLRVEMPGDIYGSGEEHVTTYARYEDYGATTDPRVIWIKLKGTAMLTGGDGDASPLAKTAIQTLRLNLPSKAYPNSDLNGEADMIAIIKASSAMLLNLQELFLKFPVQARMRGWAKKFNPKQSFIRLNNPDGKKFGEGLRVKRITIYDNWRQMTGGIEQEATYGQAYDYTTVKSMDGVETLISSGVASYEPQIGNDENPFRLPVEYEEQIAPLAPVNNMYSEFPLGEAFFPSPSVGYSKVRVHTIHHREIKSATGFEETEFYTTYDFPTRTEHTPLESRKYNSESLLNLLNLYSKKALAFSQGFQVELNDMNGKIKGKASYPEDDPVHPLGYIRYYYKVEDEHAEHKRLSNTVATADPANGHINRQVQIGKEVELMADLRQQEFISQGASMEFNMDGFMIGIIPVTIPMPWVMPHYEMNRYRSAAITKIVQRYGIPYKTMVYEKGSLVTTENLLYDGETGGVLLTQTNNEFDDPVYQFSYPAHWAYSGMGPAYNNIGAIFQQINIKDGKIISAPGYPNIENYFESGDEIKVTGGLEKTADINGVNPCTGFGVCDDPSYSPLTIPKKIWAIDAAKGERHAKVKGICFIDENGKFFTGSGNTLQIIRSGKRNMPAMPVGSTVSLESPVQEVDGQWMLVLDNTTKVVNTAASVYTDFWKVEDARYQPKTVTVKKNAMKKLVLNPLPEYTFSISKDYKSRRIGGGNSYENYLAFTNSPYFEVSENMPSSGTDTRNAHELESWMKFDLSGLPSDASIVNASLALYPHLDQHTEIRGGAYADTRNHPGIEPHHNGRNEKANESYLYLDFNTSLTYLNPLTLADGSNTVKNIYNTTNRLSPVYSTIFSTNKENSFLIDVKSLVALTRGRADKQHTWLRMRGIGAGSNGTNKLCFWSANSRSMDCSVYGPPAQQPDLLNNPSVNGRLAAIPCSSCSNVGTGIGKDFCNTAPQLTIEYIACEPGYSLIQECDSFYCVKTVAMDTCLSRFADTTVNPYRWGILGNWRLEKAYTYYDKRTENQIAGKDAETNIREYGTVNNFTPFWKFKAGTIVPTNDTIKWVWNSRSTQVNRKGYELENKDPLGRYNSVQYGYNESMPVTITQNARYTEQAYDGFEDYAYNNNRCNDGCIIQEHIDKKALKPFVTNEDAHSGLYSLGVPVGSAARLVVAMEDTLRTSPDPVLKFKIDTSERITINRVSAGTGMKATVYKNYDYTNDTYGLGQYNYSGFRVPVQPPAEYPDRDVNYDQRIAATRSLFGLSNNDVNYKITWEGYLTLRKTAQTNTTDPEGIYRFSVSAINAFKLWIDDQLVLNAFPNDPVYYNNVNNAALFSYPVKLNHGKIYKIRIEHTKGRQNEGQGRVLLNWVRPGATSPLKIPVANLHNDAGEAGASIQKNTIHCIRWDGIRASDNIRYDEFSPAAGNRYVMSAWVKEPKDCKCESYENAAIEIVFRNRWGNPMGQPILLRPSGNIIEGWQRIEEVISIPVEAVKADINFTAASGDGNTGKIFFDDWRFHPYNANMKSWVYHAINLQLMAELDENNYTSFYEYDDDGTLIRVKKETERGIKTIKETRSTLRKE